MRRAKNTPSTNNYKLKQNVLRKTSVNPDQFREGGQILKFWIEKSVDKFVVL